MGFWDLAPQQLWRLKETLKIPSTFPFVPFTPKNAEKAFTYPFFIWGSLPNSRSLFLTPAVPCFASNFGECRINFISVPLSLFIFCFSLGTLLFEVFFSGWFVVILWICEFFMMLVKTQFVEFEIQFVYSWVLVLALCLVVGKIKEGRRKFWIYCFLWFGPREMENELKYAGQRACESLLGREFVFLEVPNGGEI